MFRRREQTGGCGHRDLYFDQCRGDLEADECPDWPAVVLGILLCGWDQANRGYLLWADLRLHELWSHLDVSECAQPLLDLRCLLSRWNQIGGGECQWTDLHVGRFWTDLAPNERA